MTTDTDHTCRDGMGPAFERMEDLRARGEKALLSRLRDTIAERLYQGRLTEGCPRCEELGNGAAPRAGWGRSTGRTPDSGEKALRSRLRHTIAERLVQERTEDLQAQCWREAVAQVPDPK
jgi:hypothetical protein